MVAAIFIVLFDGRFFILNRWVCFLYFVYMWTITPSGHSYNDTSTMIINIAMYEVTKLLRYQSKDCDLHIASSSPSVSANSVISWPGRGWTGFNVLRKCCHSPLNSSHLSLMIFILRDGATAGSKRPSAGCFLAPAAQTRRASTHPFEDQTEDNWLAY